jgi:hypothetical protein
MSKEQWFRHFERLRAELPATVSDNVLVEMARDREIEEAVECADLVRLRAKENADG